MEDIIHQRTRNIIKFGDNLKGKQTIGWHSPFTVQHKSSKGGLAILLGEVINFNPFSTSMTYWVRHASYTLYAVLTYSARQDFEGRSQIVGTPNVNLFGLWDPWYLGDWWLLVTSLPYMHPRFFTVASPVTFHQIVFVMLWEGVRRVWQYWKKCQRGGKDLNPRKF